MSDSSEEDLFDDDVGLEATDSAPDTAEATVKPSAFAVADEDLLDIESEDEIDETNVLDLSSKGLSEVPAHECGDSIKTLILQKNHITSVAGLSHFPHLQSLHLDRNELTVECLTDMPTMGYLTTLWLSNNRIEDLRGLLHLAARCCPRLEYLSLLKNPVCPALYFDVTTTESQYLRYRYKVLYELPNLVFLDSSPVSTEERIEAMAKGKYLEVKKPKKKRAAVAAADDGDDDEKKEAEDTVAILASQSKAEPAAFLGRGKIKYDGRESEGNRFILNTDL